MRLTRAERIEINRIGAKYGYTHEEISKMIQSQYDLIKETLKNMDLPKNLTEEEFHKQAKNFNIPAIGKLYSSYAVYKRLNKL